MWRSWGRIYHMAELIEKTISYFSAKGKENTKDLADIVVNRLKKGGITAVAVATTSGGSALAFAEAISGSVPVFGVNFQNSTKLDSDIKRKAEAAGAVFMPEEPVAAYIKNVDGHSPDSLRCFGQGMKVAVEVIMQAVDVGHIASGDTVIGIGGTSTGADVAIVAQAAGGDNLSKMWISEILAKPL
jgi:hypothetical protein